MGRKGSVRGDSTEEISSELGFKEKPWYISRVEADGISERRENIMCKNVETRNEKMRSEEIK